MECRACRSLFVRDVPDQERLRQLYQAATPDRGSTLCWEIETRHDRSSLQRALDAGLRTAGRGPILDVGCGTGPFLTYARDQGWSDLTGLEIAPHAAAVARSASGADVYETTLDAADLPPEHYSIVALWDVVEHLPEPRRALRRIRDLLRPGGIIAVSTPNRFGLAGVVFGRRSVVVCPPEHLLIASRRGLRVALEEAGFSVEGLWSEDVRIREWTRWIGQSKPEDTRRESYRAVQGRLTSSPWFDGVRRVANIGLRATRLGDQLLAIGVRRRP
jgi:SAM-dependent methyltransferase